VQPGNSRLRLDETRNYDTRVFGPCKITKMVSESEDRNCDESIQFIVLLCFTYFVFTWFLDQS